MSRFTIYIRHYITTDIDRQAGLVTCVLVMVDLIEPTHWWSGDTVLDSTDSPAAPQHASLSHRMYVIQVHTYPVCPWCGVCSFILHTTRCGGACACVHVRDVDILTVGTVGGIECGQCGECGGESLPLWSSNPFVASRTSWELGCKQGGCRER